MAGLGLILSLLFVPEIEEEFDPDAEIDSGSEAEKKKNKKQITMRYILHVFNPLPVFKLWLYPNMFFSVRPPLHHSKQRMAPTKARNTSS
jgi:hypothetical protein